MKYAGGANRFEKLDQIKTQYVDETWEWYRSHATWPRLVFRAAGTVVILASLAIPFMVNSPDEWTRTSGVAMAALTIAVVSALNTFFAWQKTWEKRITTQLMLEGMMAHWETEMDEARKTADEDEGYELALQATRKLVEQTRSLTVSETGTWFAAIKFPDAAKDKTAPADKDG